MSPKEGKVIVEDVHMVHKHVKPSRKQGEAGGIETAGSTPARCSSTALEMPEGRARRA